MQASKGRRISWRRKFVFTKWFSLFPVVPCAQLAVILRHAVKCSNSPWSSAWLPKIAVALGYRKLPCSCIAIGHLKEGHTGCHFYPLITNDLCAIATMSCKSMQPTLGAALWRCDKNQRRKRSPMACFMTCPLTSEIDFVSGISLGQTSTQFCA